MNTRLAAHRGRMKATPVLIALAAAAVVLTAAAPAAARSTTTSAPVLAQGAGMGARPSSEVRAVQRVLDRRGYDLGAPGVDGRFGPLTDAAVRHAQSDSGLVADGVVGPKTRGALGLSRALRHGSTKATRRPGTRTPSAKAPASAKPPATAKPPAKAQPPANAKPPAAQPRPSGNANADDNGGGSATPWILAAIAAALAAAGALVAAGRRSARRRRRPTGVEPAPAAMLLEGAGEGARRANATAGAVGSADPMIGYVTLAPDVPREEADAPARAIADACEQSGRRLVDVVLDRETGPALERPGLSYALRQIAEGKARGLVVSELRRLSRSNAELGALMEWFAEADATLVGLDLGVDTTTPEGRELAGALITLGDWERGHAPRGVGNGGEDGRVPVDHRGVRARDPLVSRRKEADR
jgi:peptidoglycan hydrolase-like protein with peptidoglycan-binding domain